MPGSLAMVDASWLCRRAALRDRAEAVGADAQRQVDEVVVVLERVQPRDLDDLAVVEVPAQRLEGGVAHALVARRLVDVVERGTLALGEERARAVLGEGVELLERHVMLEGDGLPDVD